MTRLLDWHYGTIARKEDPQEFEDLFMKEMEAMLERDKRCLDDLGFRRIMAESMREAFRQGAQGPAWDCKLYSDWGFEPEEVDGRNIVLWHGKEDANAPFAMAEKAAKLIDGCSLRVVEGEAHISLSFHHIDEILQALVDLGLD